MQKGDVKKASALMMIAVFAGFLLYFAAGFIFVPFQGMNYVEQRNYAAKPELSAAGLKDGSYGKALEEYLSDHLIMRPFLVTLRSELRPLTGRTVPEVVYRGSGGQFFRRNVYSEEQVRMTAEAFNRLAARYGVPTDVLLNPDAAEIYKDKLPVGAVTDSEEMVAERFEQLLGSGISFYYSGDVIAEAASRGMKAFYLTDQHWTTECAHTVFDWYMQQSGQDVKAVSYEEHETPEYYGNLYAASPSFFDLPETTTYYTNPLGQYTVTRTDSGSQSDELIDTTMLIGLTNRYNVFLSGKFDRVRITSNAEGGKLLLLGDSYLMPMIQLFADQYKELMIVDIRLFEDKDYTIEEAIGGFEPDRIVFVDTVFAVACGTVGHF